MICPSLSIAAYASDNEFHNSQVILEKEGKSSSIGTIIHAPDKNYTCFLFLLRRRAVAAVGYDELAFAARAPNIECNNSKVFLGKESKRYIIGSPMYALDRNFKCSFSPHNYGRLWL